MSTASSSLKARNKAQAELKFACLKLGHLIGGSRKLAEVSIEEWETSRKSSNKIVDILEQGFIDGAISRKYVVADLAEGLGTKISTFLADLEVVVGEISREEEARFQIATKGEIARSVLKAAEKIRKAIEKVFDSERNDRSEWERINPRLAEQERELTIYGSTLRKLLVREGGLERLESGEWIQVEGCLKSMEIYLLENKIAAERVSETKSEELLRELLRQFEAFDREGRDGCKIHGDRVENAERAWGFIDKIGSGLAYLMRSERLRTAHDPKPTTRSIFLLRSAPPAKMIFSKTREQWQSKELSRFEIGIRDLLLNENRPIERDHEQRWSAAYTELESLQSFIKDNQIEVGLLRKSGLITTIIEVEKRIGELHLERGAQADDGVGEYALMYVTLECAMRLSKEFEVIVAA